MSTIVILFGAELNSEIEHQTIADSTTGAAKPLGRRGAKMADTVGVSQQVFKVRRYAAARVERFQQPSADTSAVCFAFSSAGDPRCEF